MPYHCTDLCAGLGSNMQLEIAETRKFFAALLAAGQLDTADQSYNSDIELLLKRASS